MKKTSISIIIIGIICFPLAILINNYIWIAALSSTFSGLLLFVLSIDDKKNRKVREYYYRKKKQYRKRKNYIYNIYNKY